MSASVGSPKTVLRSAASSSREQAAHVRRPTLPRLALPREDSYSAHHLPLACLLLPPIAFPSSRSHASFTSHFPSSCPVYFPLAPCPPLRAYGARRGGTPKWTVARRPTAAHVLGASSRYSARIRIPPAHRHYCFYRIGIQFCLWYMLCARSALVLLIELPAEVLRVYRNKRTSVFGLEPRGSSAGLKSRLSRERLAKAHSRMTRLGPSVCKLLFARVLQPFAETLVAAACLCMAYWFACLVYYRIDFWYAFDLYAGEFTRDLFGACANSGFGPVFGYPCISVDPP